MPYGLPEEHGIVTYYFTADGVSREMSTALAFKGSTIPDLAAAEAFYDALGDNLVPSLSTQYALIRCHVLFNSGLGFFEVEHAEVTAGTGAGGGITVNTCYLITKNSAQVGRKHRGRMYLPGPDEEDVGSAGIIGDLAADALQAATEAFLVDFVAVAGVDYAAILHAPVEGGPDPDPDEIISLTFQTKVATQRRRLRS